MTTPTDLLTHIIDKSVERTVERLLAPYLEKLEAAASATGAESLLTTSEVAELTQIRENTLSRWRSDLDPRSPQWVKIGTIIRYRRSDIDAWINQQTA